MTFKKAFRGFMYEHAVRKPTIAFAITVLLFITVFFALYNVEVNKYLKTDGVFTGDLQKQNDLLIEVKLGADYYNDITSDNKAIWYFVEEGKRYSGDISLIIHEKDALQLTIKPDKIDQEIISQIQEARDITVKLYIGKEKVINRIIK